jgi:UDP-N-acetylmuramate-alanine ligase
MADEEIIPRQEPVTEPSAALASLMEDGHKELYFIGIGGIGMSATAGIAAEDGYTVFGSDKKTLYAPTKDVLDAHGINYHVPYNADQVKHFQGKIYIASAGEGLENPEIEYLRKQGMPLFSFSELLYELSKNQIRVVVAGTHGKST